MHPERHEPSQASVITAAPESVFANRHNRVDCNDPRDLQWQMGAREALGYTLVCVKTPRKSVVLWLGRRHQEWPGS